MNKITNHMPTAELQALDAAHHMHPFTANTALGKKGARIMTQGKGVWLTDSEGHKIIDGMAGLWCVNIGYGRPELGEVAKRQMDELAYYNTFFQTSHVPAIALAAKIAEIAPEGMNHVFFAGSGSEANDTNIRLVRRYWDIKGQPEKRIIIARTNGYHGSTIGGGSLGIGPADMARHIAYDVGALGLTRALAAALDSPAIWSDFSRLVIDPNRGEDDPTLVMKLYEGTIIPANRHVDSRETARRLETLYRPYHSAYAKLAARRADTVIVAIHSFTPCLKGRAPRPWHVGVLYSHLDERFSKPLIARLAAEADLCIGDNEPYAGHLPGDAIDRHALQPGRHNTLIELRNDLIATPEQQQAWAARLAPILSQVLAAAKGNGGVVRALAAACGVGPCTAPATRLGRILLPIR